MKICLCFAALLGLAAASPDGDGGSSVEANTTSTSTTASSTPTTTVTTTTSTTSASTTTTAAPTTTTTTPGSTTPPGKTEEEIFLEHFVNTWHCTNNTGYQLNTTDIRKMIFEETLNIVTSHHPKQYDSCYVRDANMSVIKFPDPAPMRLFTKNATGCEKNTTRTYSILTSITSENQSSYLACLLHDESIMKYHNSFVTDAVCANTSKETSKDSFISVVTCINSEHPPAAQTGSVAGPLFGGLVLGVIVTVAIYLIVRLKCGRGGGFSQESQHSFTSQFSLQRF